jgi:hypothetical protein
MGAIPLSMMQCGNGCGDGLILGPKPGKVNPRAPAANARHYQRHAWAWHVYLRTQSCSIFIQPPPSLGTISL